MLRLLLFCIMIDLALLALHHNALSLYLAYLSIRLRVRRVRTGSLNGASSSQINY
jgi:hypothetical protein